MKKVLVGLVGSTIAAAVVRRNYPLEIQFEDAKDLVHFVELKRGFLWDRLEVCTKGRVEWRLDWKLPRKTEPRCQIYNSFWPIQVKVKPYKDDLELTVALEEAYEKILAERKPPFFLPNVDYDAFDEDDIIPYARRPDRESVEKALQKIVDEF